MNPSEEPSVRTLLLCLALLLPPVAAAQDDSRLPVPAALEIEAAALRFRDAHKAELSKTTLDEQSEAVHKLLADLKRIQAAPIDQYARLHVVRRLAAAIGDHDLYLDASLNLSQIFRVSYRQIVADGQAEVLANASPFACRKLLPSLQASVQEAIRDEEFDVARKTIAALKAASLQADKLGSTIPIHAESARLFARDVEPILEKYAGLAGARTRLREMPADGPAHRVVGEFLCFVKNDWKAGLPHLAACADPALRKAADNDLDRNKQTADDLLRTADGWHAAARAMLPIERANAWHRALELCQGASEKSKGVPHIEIDAHIRRFEVLTDARLPMPEKDEIAAMTNVLRTSLQAQFAKSPSAAQKVANELLDEVDRHRFAPTAQAAFLIASRGVAARGGDMAAYLRAANQMSKSFRVSTTEALADDLDTLVANTSPNRTLADLQDLLDAIDSAISGGDFVALDKVVKAAEALARKAEAAATPAQRQAIARKLTSATKLSGDYRSLPAAWEKLLENPGDGPANRVVGRYLCFVTEDWNRGLVCLAACSDEALRNAAERDRKAVSGNQLDTLLAGDAWFDVAADLEPLQQANARMRADLWYRRTAVELDDRLTPLVDKLFEASPRVVLRADPMQSRVDNPKERALRDGATAESEAAVDRGLEWLVRVQSNDGRWKLDGPFPDKGNANDAAGTALGLLPFLGAGCTHKTGKHRKTVDAGLRRLLEFQDRETGSFSRDMYAHGLCMLAVCEACGMTDDPALKKAAQRAVDWTVRAQHGGGGWRYQPGQAGDTSVTTGQVVALKAATLAGLEVPKATLRKAATYLDNVLDGSTEGYGYVGPNPTPTMTAAALLCRETLQEWDARNKRLGRGIVNFVKPNYPTLNRKDIYYHYYATQTMHRYGGADWKAWNEKMRDLLVNTQEKDDAGDTKRGSWSPAGDNWGRTGGRLMQTSLSVLTLEVYYRYSTVSRE
jgi:hypothetical protein